MSFVTACPQCSTRFVIKPEQLAVRKGRVRCGNCRHVFNALLSMQQVTDAAIDEALSETAYADELTEQNSPHAAEIEQQIEAEQVEGGLEQAETNLTETELTETGLIEAEFTEIVPYETRDTEAEYEFAPTDSSQENQEEAATDGSELGSDEQPLDNALAESALAGIAGHDALTAEQPDDLEDHLGNESVHAYTSNPSVPDPAPDIIPAALEQIPLPHKLAPYKRDPELFAGNKVLATSTSTGLFLILVLLSIAAMQSVYFLRTSITSAWPVSRPYFVTACTYIGCNVDLPKNADLLLLDDSDLHEDAERLGLIHLNSTLINSAQYVQDYPLLEVTLTDNNDAPVLRRTFKPAEYLAKGSNLKAGLAAKDEVHIQLALSADEKSVSGYRVFVTY